GSAGETTILTVGDAGLGAIQSTSSVSATAQGRASRFLDSRGASILQIFFELTEERTFVVSGSLSATKSSSGNFSIAQLNFGGFGADLFARAGADHPPFAQIDQEVTLPAGQHRLRLEASASRPRNFAIPDEESVNESSAASWNITVKVLEDRLPVLLIPGIAGTYAANVSSDLPCS
ncbi:MAG: hypothetical protein ACREQY_10990, partial [Candidatus Binatia bacterium]